MEGLRGELPPSLVPHPKMDSSYKVDEGYSEDNRSQDGLESPTGMETDGGNLLQSHIMSADGLSSAVAALSETEKAGMLALAQPLQIMFRYRADGIRIRVQYPTHSESLVYI